MKKTQGWHIRTIPDVEKQWNIIHHHKIQMVLAAARKKHTAVSALKRKHMILQMKEMKIDLHMCLV